MTLSTGHGPPGVLVSRDALLGKWLISRTITDQPTISGVAIFTLDGSDRLRYREDVNIMSGEKAVKAHWEYVYVFGRDSVVILHGSGESAGQHFLSITPVWDPVQGAFVASDTHVCKLDRYDAQFRFTLPDRFFSSYVVRGPSKDYRIETVYQRGD